MDKSVIGLVAAIGALTPISVAHATVTSQEAENALRVSSVAELLEATPNAAAVLTKLDADAKASAVDEAKGVQVAWHHHHWHHHFYHHHHHHWYYHHHHHHHWHHHHWHHHWF